MIGALTGRCLDASLLRYRIMAWVTGTILAVMSCVGLPLQYVAGQDAWSTGWTIHGFLYIVYLITAFSIVRRMRWSVLPSLGVLLAGTIPFLTFVAEHQVTRLVHESLGRQVDAPAPTSTAEATAD
jgi:integral membrane protein